LGGGAFFQPQPLFRSLKTSLICKVMKFYSILKYNMLEGKILNAPKDSKIFYSWSIQTKQQQELLIG